MVEVTEEQKKEIGKLKDQILDLQKQLEQVSGKQLSDREFCRRYLQFSASSWSAIKTGTYPAGLASMIDKARNSVRTLMDAIPQVKEAAKFSTEIKRTMLFKSAEAAINRALNGVDNRKVVVILAPSGFGKTEFARNVLLNYRSVVVEGRQAWQSSYRSFCADICRAMGVKVLPAREGAIEEMMVDKLYAEGGILYIDEANTMSPACANAIKGIVNRTGCTVVISAIPEMWDRFLQGNRDEVAQLVNRCQPIIRCKTIREDDVKMFLAQIPMEKEAMNYAVRKVTNAANIFGGLRTVITMAKEFRDLNEVTIDDIDKTFTNFMNDVAASGISGIGSRKDK